MTSALPPEEPSLSIKRTDQSAMFGRIVRLCLKELREILRDRRTIITLVLMPLLLYPALSLVFNKFMLSQSAVLDPDLEILVGFDTESDAQAFFGLVETGNAILDSRKASTSDFTSVEWRALELQNAQADLDKGNVDVAISRPLIDEASNKYGPWQITHRPNSPIGEQAVEVFRRRLEIINESFVRNLLSVDAVKRQLAFANIPAEIPAAFEVREIEGESTAPVASLTSFIPLMLILMTVTGAVYPAIDLTAGERERGTMEALIAAPIPRIGLLLAKYVAVVFVALLTAFANMLAMSVTLYVTGLQDVIFGEAGLSFSILSQVFGLLILFSAFFSAVLLAITSFARSFKEAQAYLIPLMLLALGPGLISLSPEIELTTSWAVTPLVNIVLLARDVMSGTFEPIMGLIVIQATLIYAIAALTIAARVFGTDAILYGSQKGWKDFFTRPAEPQSAVSISTAFFCLALVFLLLFYALGLLAQFRDLPMQTLAYVYSGVSVITFVLIPLAFAWGSRVRVVDGFRLHLNPWRVGLGTIGSVFLGLSLWTWAHELALLGQWLGWVSFDEKQVKVDQLVAQWRTLSPFLVVFAWGITPAVVEEFFFRGFLFRALETKFRPIHVIWISAVIFGAFHVVGAQFITPERFLPSAMMGLFLGIVAYRSGSIVPGILLHAIHNSGLVLLAYYQDWLEQNNLGVQDADHLPTNWYLYGLVGIVIGTGIVWVSGIRSKSKPTNPPLVAEVSSP